MRDVGLYFVFACCLERDAGAVIINCACVLKGAQKNGTLWLCRFVALHVVGGARDGNGVIVCLCSTFSSL